jgi:methionyl-tRNA synthetase
MLSIMAESSKKRKDLSLQEKQRILECYNKLPKMSQSSAAVHLKISQPLLCKILKNISDIETSALTNENMDWKRARSGKDSQVESALKIWFSNVREKNASINGPLMRQKAEELAKTIGKEKFNATDGWFNRWKKRENIVYKRMQGAEKSADFFSS